jgi:hypothetical protein
MLKRTNLQLRIKRVIFVSILISISSLISPTDLQAQVGGISGSKLNAYCVDVVDHKKIEFEPAFFHFNSKTKWNDDGHLDNIYGTSDSVFHNTGINFRFTYGLWDKLEVGASVSTDLQTSNWGLRYVLYQKKKIGLALIAGANIPFGNKAIDKSLRLSDNIASVGGGAVFSTQFSENLSFDFTAQYMTFIKTTNENHKGSYYLSADIGYYILNHQLQFIAGLGYQQASFDKFTSSTLTVYPGVTVETGNNYIIVLSVPFDIYGTNANKNVGLLFALTLTFD